MKTKYLLTSFAMLAVIPTSQWAWEDHPDNDQDRRDGCDSHSYVEEGGCDSSKFDNGNDRDDSRSDDSDRGLVISPDRDK